MTTEQIAALYKAVSSMRDAQKEYFKSRSGAALRESKMWEARVDKLVLLLEPAVKALEVKTEQKSLF